MGKFSFFGLKMSEDYKNIKNKNETSENIWQKYKIWFIIGIVVFIVIIAVIVFIVLFTRKNKKEGFTGNLQGDNKINLNGHVIDCTPEINYMKEYLKTSQIMD